MKTASLGLLLAAAATSVMAADATPPTAPTAFVFEEVASLGPVQVVGETPYGRRQSIPITGGTVTGPGISGRILPGADYQLVRADGAVQIDADYTIETDDHVRIHVRNTGLAMAPGKDQPGYAWAAPRFDAPNGKYGWLNSAIFVSRISGAGDKDHPAVRITIWKVG